MNHPGIQIDILPAQAQQLRPAQPGQQIEDDRRSPLDWLRLEQLEHPLRIRLIQIPGLMSCH